MPCPPLQLAPFTCFALEDLRPAVPIAAVLEPAPDAVPALSLKTIRVGACYEFDVRGGQGGQASPGGQAASQDGGAYVPAVVLRKVQVRAPAPAPAGGDEAGGGGGAGAGAAQAAGLPRSRSLARVLERLDQRRAATQQQVPQQQQQQQAQEPQAGASIKLLLWRPGAGVLWACVLLHARLECRPALYRW